MMRPLVQCAKLSKRPLVAMASTQKFLLIPLLILVSCSTPSAPSDPTAPDQANPCIGRKPLSAQFRMFNQESLNSNVLARFETDTFNVGDIIYLDYGSDGYDYQWFFWGQLRDRFTVRSMNGFAAWPPESGDLSSAQPVGLFAYRRAADTLCFPGDKRVDTVFKKYHVVEFRFTTLGGTYRGVVNDNPADTSTVEIYYMSPPGEPETARNRRYYIRNIQPGCRGMRGFDAEIIPSYRSGVFRGDDRVPENGIVNDSLGYCFARHGAIVRDGDSLTVTYWIDADKEIEFVDATNGNTLTKVTATKGRGVFKGKRLALPTRKLEWW